MGRCIMFTGIGLLLHIHPFISSFFFLSKFQTLKFFVTLFSGAVRPRRLKLGTHIDSGQMYCVYRNQAAAAYSSLYKLACTKYKDSYCSHPGRPCPHSRHTATKFYFQVFQKFISWQPLIRKHSYLDHRYPGGPAFIPWFLTPGLIWKQLRQIVCRTSVSLVTLTYGSWSEGHHDLYFTVQWFCLISWRLFDIWTPYFRIMSQYDTTFDLKIKVTVTYISWSSDFALYLEDCLMYEHHTSGLWVSMTRHLTSK